MGNSLSCIGESNLPVLPSDAHNLTPGPTSDTRYSFGEQVSFGETSPSGGLLEKPNLRNFSFAELKSATKNFNPETLLGEGGFGNVYKGWVDEISSKSGLKIAVAIKKLKSESPQGFEEWQNYDAKLSDFGLAKLGPSGGNSHVTTRVMGTYGYVAPEYVATGHLHMNSDVYGFGVVLLEMLTGMRAVDMNRPKGQQNLVGWAKPYLSSKSKLRTIMDVRFEGEYSINAAFALAQLTVKCLRLDPETRPSMKEAVEVLQRIEAIKGQESKPNTQWRTIYH